MSAVEEGQLRTGFVDNAQQVRLHEVCGGKTVETQGDSRSHWCVTE